MDKTVMNESNSSLAARMDRLSDQQRRALMARLKEIKATQNVRIPRRPSDMEWVPLSFAQERLWFLSRLDSGSSFYNEAGAVELSGILNETALQDSLAEIVRRHEILRTCFVERAGKVQQIIIPELDIALRHVDCQSLSGQDKAQQIECHLSEELQQPFDLGQVPPIRFTLIRFAQDQHVLMIGLHHIIADEWSIRILLHELSMIYNAYCDGQPSPLAELPVQYADYACWQRQQLDDAALDRQLAYWRQRLDNCSPVLELPLDFLRPAKPKHKGGQFAFSIPGKLAAAMSELARSHDVTPFMLFLSVYALLLHRHTRQKDFCIGYPVTNRTKVELQSVIGFFTNSLVLRMNFSGHPTLASLLQMVKTRCLEGQANQDLPFEKLVEELSPQRDMRYNPLFQVWFVYQNAKDTPLQLNGLTLSPVRMATESAKFDLALAIEEGPDTLTGRFEYDTELFQQGTMARWAEHYLHLMQELVRLSDVSLAESLSLPDRERHRLMQQWNDTSHPFPQSLCIHELIKQQAENFPTTEAVIFENRKLTYAQLDSQSQELADYLRTRGVGPDVLVGVFAERSLEMVVAILAILKAGGAYVPLDPSYPPDHIAYVLNDAQPRLVLTQSALQDALPGHIERFCLDMPWPFIPDLSLHAAAITLQPHHLAYVIYTSGSTGHPKGVAVTHRNIVYSTTARSHYYRVTASKFLLLSSIAFDSSMAGIFGTLCQGGTLIIPSEKAARDLHVLANLIKLHRVSHLLTIPAFYEALLPQIGTSNGNSLDQVIVAGEPCHGSVLQQHRMYLPHAALFNEYGPTEATVWCSVHRCDIDDEKIIPIGRPIANTRIYLLDDQLNPVPIGTTGEVYVGGEGLARGYLHQSSLTAQRYVPDPFGQTGERLYRTGDLARYRTDGNLEYLGRSDNQVKIRGFRIELGEIEAVLLRHAQIAAAVVMPYEDDLGVKRLVAYLVGHPSAPGADQIRSHLKVHLPDHMIPFTLMFLEQLPLTPNGKVDRQALPAPKSQNLLAQQNNAPVTPTEARVIEIWCEILGLEDEHMNSAGHFFELGGHSLLAMQVIARVDQEWSINMPLQLLFEQPVLSDFAREIDFLCDRHDEPQILPLIRVIREQNLPLSYAQERLWFLGQFDPDSAFYNMSGAIRLHGELDVAVLQRALKEIVRRHEVLRTTFEPSDGVARQIIHPAWDWHIPVADLSAIGVAEQVAAVQRHLQAEADQPFDLAQGPLVRASLLFLGKVPETGMPEHILMFTLHHIVSDGWSTAILIREFMALYTAYRNDTPSPLTELTIQYVDYAVWQRQWLQGDKLEQHLQYWRQHLTEAPPVLELPLDRPRPAVQSYRGTSHLLTITPALTERLKVLGRQQDATLFMVLLAAFNVLLSRHSGQQDICIGTPVANRNRLEIEGLIGFFVNTLVLRCDLSGNPTFLELLQRVRDVCLGAQAHQDLPFEKLVEELAPVRDMSHNPLFQVMLSLQNVPEASLEMESLRIEPLSMETHTSKFDLDLNITERPTGLEVQFNYNTDLFDAATIERMAEHYRTILEDLSHSPGQRLNTVRMLPPAEWQQLMRISQGAVASYPQDHCIHELFEAQVERDASRVAVVLDAEWLSYGELNRQANRLAHALRQRGVGAETVVGICMERSLEMVVALLGILKAGGAYLPIDPGYPAERIAYMLNDAQPVCVLVHNAIQDVLPPDMPVIDLQTEQAALAAYSGENLQLPMSAQHPAYVMYTSGSTGHPKGAILVHQGIVNRLLWMQREYQLDESDRILQKTPFGFDVSVWEFFWPLMVGACLHLLPPGAHRDSLRMAEVIERQVITTLHFVPSMLSVFLDSVTTLTCTSLKRVICSGEALSASLQQRFFDRLPAAKLHNLYGPTEASIDVTYWACHADRDETVVPIGYPIANMGVYLLDRHLNPVPTGVMGELFISGIGLARGYLNRSELTADRFIPHPFDENGSRMYRSGDLARFRRDGSIEYLGRTDHQVKLRGVRIELGEIEAALRRHPEIRDAVVVVADTPGSEHQILMAYAVSSNAKPDTEALHTFLRAFLTEHMVPSIFMWLDELPLNANGKIDRKALLAPHFVASQSRVFVAPRTPTESVLAGIWAEVLNLKRIGVHDNFFELGGHSLLVTQLLSRIHGQFQLRIPLRVLFEATTIARLAEVIEMEQWRQTSNADEMNNSDAAYEDIAI